MVGGTPKGKELSGQEDWVIISLSKRREHVLEMWQQYQEQTLFLHLVKNSGSLHQSGI